LCRDRPVRSSVSQDRLRLVPKRLADDRRVRARIRHALVHSEADIQPVAQDPVEIAEVAANVLSPELLSERGRGSGRPDVDPVDQTDRMTEALAARLRDDAKIWPQRLPAVRVL
jgi:hypothetical protein